MRSKCCSFEGTYLFPENRQKKVRIPFGDIYTDKNFDELSSVIKGVWSRGGYIVSVGDRVTYSLIEHGVIPDVGVIDGKERRGEAPTINFSYFNKVYQKRNEKGTVNMSLCCFIKNVLRERPVLIVIEGEEDLVGFPAVLALPVGSLFLYGQPHVGAVLVHVDEKIKENAYLFLSSLKKIRD